MTGRVVPSILFAVVTLLPTGGLRAQQTEPVPGESSAVAVVDERPAEDVKIRPGDQIALRIDREPDLGGTFTVAEDGSVVLPRLGNTVVTDISAQALQDTLTAAYSVYLREPKIEAVVLRRIGVQGEVRRPDVYMVDLTVTLRELLAKAGGVTEAGNPNKIFIIRGNERIRVAQDASARFRAAELRSGDQILIGQRSWFGRNSLAIISTAVAAVPALFVIYDRLK